MKLYHMPGACSLADLIVLNWIGAPHEAVRMTFQAIKSPSYLAINAGGTVPLLEHGDFRLTENVAILGYLADLHPEEQLLGDGTARGRAEVMRWLGFLNSDVHKAFKPIFAPARYLPDAQFADSLASMARGHVRHYMERLDQQLNSRDWLTGQRSIADPYLYVLVRWARAKGVDLRDLNNLARFADRMDSDSAVRAALAFEQTDSPTTAPQPPSA
jgi:glutathione S-transferase